VYRLKIAVTERVRHDFALSALTGVTLIAPGPMAQAIAVRAVGAETHGLQRLSGSYGASSFRKHKLKFIEHFHVELR